MRSIPVSDVRVMMPWKCPGDAQDDNSSIFVVGRVVKPENDGVLTRDYAFAQLLDSAEAAQWDAEMEAAEQEASQAQIVYRQRREVPCSTPSHDLSFSSPLFWLPVGFVTTELQELASSRGSS
jgi:hypothetical protein